jgi:hypothetical protein
MVRQRMGGDMIRSVRMRVGGVKRARHCCGEAELSIAWAMMGRVLFWW